MQRLIDSIPAKRDQVIQRTKSTLARKLPVEARRDMQGEVNLTAARISAGLSCTQTSDGVILTGAGRAIGLINVPYTSAGRSPGGVTARPYVQGAPITAPHAFVAIGANGNKQIFQRNGVKVRQASGKYAGQLREGIKPMYAPSVAAQLRHGDRADRLADFGATVLHDESERLLDG